MTGIADHYAARVQAGDIHDDPAQRAVLPHLDKIETYLETTPPPGKGGLSRLFGRNAAPEAPKGLYLWGGVGRGKSMVMDLFVETLDIDAKRRVHFHAFMQEIHAAMHKVRQTGADDALLPVARDVAQDVRLLAFDEMQITDITDAMIVGRLFEALFQAGVIVVTTSNRAPDDLYKDGLNRALFLPFIDLIKTRMVVHELASPSDYRQNRLAGEPVYFTPHNAAARMQIDAIWGDLTGGADAPLDLTVQGRQVRLDRFHNGAARVTFWDLCAKPLGPADYLAIAAAVRVLVIENVPHLSRSNYNEAKRFVTLIDALYEAGVRVILSAADQPESLYLEGEGTFEFARTASRLREMQSAGWGADAA